MEYRLWASGREGPGRARGSTELRGRLVEGVETGELSSVPSCFTEPCPELAALMPRGVRGVRGVGTEKRGVAGDGRMPAVVLTEAVVPLIWPYSWSVRVLTLGMFLEHRITLNVWEAAVKGGVAPYTQTEHPQGIGWNVHEFTRKKLRYSLKIKWQICGKNAFTLNLN